jgi:hypothetical protein
LDCFLDSHPDDVQRVVLIPIVPVSNSTKVVVDYWKVYDSVRISWNDFLVNATDELDPVRYEPGNQIRIPCFAISTIVKIDTSYPVIGKLRL